LLSSPQAGAATPAPTVTQAEQPG